MGEIQFDSDNKEYARPRFQGGRIPGLTGLLMRAGIVSSQRSAEYVLIILTAVAVIVTFFLWNMGGKSKMPPPDSKIIYLSGQPPRLEFPVLGPRQ